jgi:acyl transferase domain-containing protein
MGWYTTLGLSGALPYEEMLRLIETMGQYQHGNVIGGQLVYSIVDENWQMAPDKRDLVESVVAQVPDLYWSIRLGGQAVLGGTNEALNRAIELLPVIDGIRPFPFKLPLHSAFHTPLMLETHRQALRDLNDLRIQTPAIPIIDGTGRIWRSKACSTAELLQYTLGSQVFDQYDFSAMIRTVLKQIAPDHIILLGPGSNLGGAVAHVLIEEGWQGIRSKTDFIRRQQEHPFIIAMGRSDQRSLVTR